MKLLEKVMPPALQHADNVSLMLSQEEVALPPRWPLLALGTFMILGGVGNALVCVSIFIERRLQNVTNYFLFSLAVADLLVSVLVMPISILVEIHHGYWPYGFLFCASHTYVDVFLCSASIVHMSIISVDRYLGISQPLKIRNKSQFVVTLKIVAVWVITTTISCPIIILAVVNPGDIYKNNICAMDNPYFMVYGSTLAFLIPSLIMAVTYIRTTQLLRQEAIICGNTVGGSRSSRSSTRGRGSMEGLRRTHVRHRRAKNAQDRQRTIDSNEESTRGSRSGLNSPIFARNSFRYSNCNNNNHAKNKAQNKPKPTNTSEATLIGSTDLPLTKNGAKTPYHGPHRAPSEESQETGAPNQLQAVEGFSNASTGETFRSKFKERTMTLWSKTTRKGASPSELANEQKATRVLGLVFGCFFFCWTPFFVHNFTLAFCRDSCHIPRWMASVFLWLGYISSTINPIIYTVFSEKFRKAFLKIVTCRCRRTLNPQHQFVRVSGGSSFQAPSIGPSQYGFVTAYACGANSLEKSTL